MSFSIDLARFAEKTGGRIDTVLQVSVLKIFSSVVLKSPVDTGRFRANWNIGSGVSDKSTSVTTDRNGTSTISAALVKAKAYKAGPTVFITNALPYAQRLEYGYSKQAPGGMVRITVAEFKDYVRDAVRGLS